MDLRSDTPAARHVFVTHLARETWILYGVGMLFIVLRTIPRLRKKGFKGLSPDDYLMWVAALWYTLLVICLNLVASGGGSNLYPLSLHKTFTEEAMKRRIRGSKLVVVSEQAMLNVIYTLKCCMLLIYSRLTLQLEHRRYVKMLAIYVGCGYTASQLTFFLECRPFNGYWKVPPPQPQCATLKQYAITQAVFNISSDLAMLAISIPLFLTTTLPLKQKLVLIVLFGGGIFVPLAAILTKYFNLSEIYSTRYMFWYVREASVAVYVTNLPLIWPLLRDTFPFLRSFSPGGYRSHSSRRQRATHSSSFAGQRTTIGGTMAASHLSVADRGIQLSGVSRTRDETASSIKSDERILYEGGMGCISHETTVEIEQASLAQTETGDLGEARRHCWDGNIGEGCQARGYGNRSSVYCGAPRDTGNEK